MCLKHVMMIEDLKAWKDDILKMLHENGVKCPCGGSFNDWHSHDSDCVVIKPTMKEVKKKTYPGKWGDEEERTGSW